MAYPYKWSPVSYRSSAGLRKFAGQRPTFYRCATQPTTLHKMVVAPVYITEQSCITMSIVSLMLIDLCIMYHKCIVVQNSLLFLIKSMYFYVYFSLNVLFFSELIFIWHSLHFA